MGWPAVKRWCNRKTQWGLKMSSFMSKEEGLVRCVSLTYWELLSLTSLLTMNWDTVVLSPVTYRVCAVAVAWLYNQRPENSPLSDTQVRGKNTKEWMLTLVSAGQFKSLSEGDTKVTFFFLYCLQEKHSETREGGNPCGEIFWWQV